MSVRPLLAVVAVVAVLQSGRHDGRTTADAFQVHRAPHRVRSAPSRPSSVVVDRQNGTPSPVHGARATRRPRPEASALRMTELGDASVASLYSHCLKEYYFQTQMATGAVFCAIGDVLAQARTIYVASAAAVPDSDGRAGLPVATDRLDAVPPGTTASLADLVSEYDPRRTFNYFLKGIGGGVMWACWYQIADTWSLDITNELFESLSPVDSIEVDLTQDSPQLSRWFQPTRTAVSILLEQFVVCPIFYAFWDIPVPAMLSGSPPRQIPMQIKQKLGPLLIANAQVWTLVNTITYNLPLQYRVLFASFADILWQCINASITSQEIETPATARQSQLRVQEDTETAPAISAASVAPGSKQL